MTTTLSITRDVGGYPTTGEQSSRKFTDSAVYFTLAANVITTVTVPQNTTPVTGSPRMMAFFKFANTTGILPVVWVQPGATPVLTLPGAPVTATTATLNPSGREVVPGQVLQFLTDQANDVVSVEFYAILN